MKKINNNTGKYQLPAEFRASMPVSMHFLHLFMTIIFASFIIFLPNYECLTIRDIIFIITSCIIVAFCIINWLYWGILRKGKIRIDNQGIEIDTLYVKKSFRWQDISSIGFADSYPRRNQRVLQIKLFELNGDESFMDKLNFKLLGKTTPIYNISFVCFSDVNWYAFMRTVNEIFDSINPSSTVDE